MTFLKKLGKNMEFDKITNIMQVIEIKYRDEQDYICTGYFTGFSVDESNGWLEIDINDNPLAAKQFKLVDTQTKKSVVNVIKGLFKAVISVEVKELKITLE